MRLKGPTRHGGAYAVVYYHDGRGEPVAKERATGAIVTEYTRDGRVVAETVLTFGAITTADRKQS